MIRLKDILSEAYAWERQEGKPLPTLAEVQAAYDARMREEAKPDFLDLDDDGDEEESMKSAAKDADDDKDPEPEKWSTDKLEKEPDDPFDTDLYDDDDDDGNYYMDEAAKPDFLDLDGDGNETESMKSAAADSTPHGNNIGPRRAKAQLKNNKDDSDIYGHDAFGTVTKLNSPSDVDDVKYKNFTIKTESLAKAFNKRMLGNLHGHEYILREAFKRK